MLYAAVVPPAKRRAPICWTVVDPGPHRACSTFFCVLVNCICLEQGTVRHDSLIAEAPDCDEQLPCEAHDPDSVNSLERT